MTGEAPLKWMRAIRDAVPRFTPTRQQVLFCLALRMRPSGTGFASAKTLGDDAQCGEQTARRATDDASKRGYLNRTRRGHRRGDGTSVASEWELILPADVEPQPVTPDQLSTVSSGHPVPVENASTGTGLPVEDGLNRSGGASQPVTPDRPRGPVQEGKAAAAGLRITGATDEEVSAVVAELRRTRRDVREADNEALLRHILKHDGPSLVAKLREDRAREQAREDVAAFLKRAHDAPPCHPEHAVPGGNLLRPDTGKPLCPLCRKAAERAAA